MRTGIQLGGCSVLLFVLLGGPTISVSAAEESTPAQVEFFEKEVRPLLAGKCWQCHGDTKKPKGGLRLISREYLLKGGDSGPVIAVGDPAGSALIQAVRYEQEPKMPPREKLKDREIEILMRWVAQGAPWPDTDPATPKTTGRDGAPKVEESRRFWSFQPVRAVAVPAVRGESWPRTPVDRFILAAIEEKGLTHASSADKRPLIRRATFDLIGLPPTPEEIADFLADDTPEAFARVVERLLASPRYGERWGRHWLDAVRYADARDLIQLPAESDFREAWRYRDWVVESFNRDLPYTEFLLAQLAGDLLPPDNPGGINRDGIIATGLLAIADFVPGDVDKEQMIADYVNDQIDVVSRTFLGLTIACARCHDHKFDPISTEDYYALAGIFFSTRLIPGPVPGNTPLVRVPLLPKDELARIEAQGSEARRRLAELERRFPDAADRAYAALLPRLVVRETARYLVAAAEMRRRGPEEAKTTAGEMARKHGLHPGLLARFVEYLGDVADQSSITRHPVVREIAAGTLADAAMESSAKMLQDELGALAARRQADAAISPGGDALAGSRLIRVHAEDPQIVTDPGERVTLWPNRSGLPGDARPAGTAPGPVKVRVAMNGHTRTVLRYDGQSLLELPRRVPANGTALIVFRNENSPETNRRLLGWEDSDTGKHGLGVMLDPGGRLHAILRDNGRSGDLIDTHPAPGFEIICLSWGPKGTTLHRNGIAAGSGKGVETISSDTAIAALRLGGPGSGGSPRFRGDLAEVQVYDRPLDEAERLSVEVGLRADWFDPPNQKKQTVDPLSELYEELISVRGPFWIAVAEERAKMLPPEVLARLDEQSREIEALKKRPPAEIPRAVAVQDGGPKGTRHEGFKDSHVFLRGNPKKLGKRVPRGIPRVLMAGDNQPRFQVAEESGRRQLAAWLARSDHPLTARVMVNRIWQHHFGEGLVRSPNDFGERGERPTHPDLLDFLATRFVESGCSVKAMHRLIMLSSTYQQSSRAEAETLAKDPENRLFTRMGRRRLEAEAIRDSLLAVAGRLDVTHGGPAFSEISSPRRSIYFQSVRTGPGTSDFGRLFDRADPGSIVARRGESVVAPQALFFLNDPFVGEMGRALAARIVHEGFAGEQARIGRLYALVLGRDPSPAEVEIGLRLLKSDGMVDPWGRYCHLILCQNEFLYLD